jgi:hypothetical protein
VVLLFGWVQAKWAVFAAQSGEGDSLCKHLAALTQASGGNTVNATPR